MQVRLLPANEEDKAEVWDMFVPAMRPYIEKIWSWEIEWQANEFNSRFFELNTSFVIYKESKIGYVQYELNENDTYLNMIVLDPRFQGEALGREALHLIQNLQPDKRLRLRCFHVNKRALCFYLNNGFTVLESEESSILLERIA
ncbi:GNAT family N-acetyltransferase [Reinekea sp.]|jgi:RimJ/RimL family protein N-acetyltransferase|uniref:GNAT family N-acetyltransferase n=1 Tax=Reinekea sp. TaxID=1970455 RepID=UPI003988ED3C